MRTASVYHAIKPTFGFGDIPFNSNNFVLVALVEVPDGFDEVSWAYQMTNHIDRPWWENDDVTLLVAPKQRSTSVGDVVVISTGEAFRCASLGWEKAQVMKPLPAKKIFSGSPTLTTADFIFVYDPADSEGLTEEDGFLPDLVEIYVRSRNPNPDAPGGMYGHKVGSFCIDNKGGLDCQTLEDSWPGAKGSCEQVFDRAVVQFLSATARAA